MPIPDEKARAWTRPEDYWPPRRVRRSGRPRSARLLPSAVEESAGESRPFLDVVPYAVLLLGLAVLAIAIMALAWPGRTVPQKEPEPVPVEVGTAPKGWMERGYNVAYRRDLAGTRDRHAVLGQVRTVRTGRDRHVDTVVHQQQRAPAQDRPQRDRQVVQVAAREVLLTQLHHVRAAVHRQRRDLLERTSAQSRTVGDQHEARLRPALHAGGRGHRCYPRAGAGTPSVGLLAEA